MPLTSSQPRIAYEDRGSGEPALLFMPGWCATRAAFGRLPELLAAGRRTLALDWRGHGESERNHRDFGNEGLLEDALAVIDHSGAERVIPVALAHAGWVAIELRRRLADRVPKLVLLEWIVTEAPPPFLEALAGLQDPERWQETRDRLFSIWLEGVEHPGVIAFL